jgi:hypothetical protein
MKFILSAPPTDPSPDGLLSVKVNNISRRGEQWKKVHHLSETPAESHIAELNILASKPPFCFIYKVKKYDTL